MKYQIISVPEGKSGRWEVTRENQPAGFTSPTDLMRSAFFGSRPIKRVAFSDPTTWHQLKMHENREDEPEGLMMTDSVAEQEQCHRETRGFSGKVLIGGLGLGVVLAVLGRRKDKINVVVVEKEKDVIDLVWPHVDTKKFASIECVHQDLFEYLRECSGLVARFDYAFYDIWASDSERSFFKYVVPLRHLSENVVPQVKLRCWNEDVMRGQLYMNLITALQGLVMASLNTEHGSVKFDVESVAQSYTDKLDGALEKLCTIMESPFHDWMVPFWTWYRDACKRDDWHESQMQTMSRAYAGMYGLPGWRVAWETAISRADRSEHA